MIPDELQAIDWLPPWCPVSANDSRLADELAREVGEGHPLAGRSAVAIARREDQDDVLFWLPAGPTLLAVVHLTWASRRERSPDWPSTTLYESVAEWVERGMRADHSE